VLFSWRGGPALVGSRAGLAAECRAVRGLRAGRCSAVGAYYILMIQGKAAPFLVKFAWRARFGMFYIS